jgi:hypothetical protein
MMHIPMIRNDSRNRRHGGAGRLLDAEIAAAQPGSPRKRLGSFPACAGGGSGRGEGGGGGRGEGGRGGRWERREREVRVEQAGEKTGWEDKSGVSEGERYAPEESV